MTSKYWLSDTAIHAQADGYDRSLREHILGDIPVAHFDADINQIFLPPREQQELQDQLGAWRKQAVRAPTAQHKGYPVAAEYHALVEGWTTLSKIIQLQNRWRIFVLYNYPNARARRNADRRREWLCGDHLRKPRFEEWKERVECRSVIPTLHGTPDDFVAMPYICSVNAYDVFARPDQVPDWGDFLEFSTYDRDACMYELAKISIALCALHRRGQTWGEAILPNVILTKARLPIWVDPETTYEGLSPLEEQAMDVRNLIVSASGALMGKANASLDLDVCGQVMSAHSQAVLKTLDLICKHDLSWRERLLFDSFGKYRVGARNLEHFEQIRRTIRLAIDIIFS